MRSYGSFLTSHQANMGRVGLAATIGIVGLLSVGCGGNGATDNPAPNISGFRALSSTVPSGFKPSLLANFSVKGGTAVVTPGNLTIQGGTPLSVPAITADTTYTLTVTSDNGAQTTATTLVQVATQSVGRVVTGSVAGLGMWDGAGSAAQFNSPQNMAADAQGNIFFADVYNHTIRKMTPDGVVITVAGIPGVSGSASATAVPAASATFKTPRGVVVDATGNIFVADGNAKIRKIDTTGSVTTLVTTGATFNSPNAIAIGSDNNLYVADYGANAVLKVAPTGGVVTAITATPAFSKPSGIVHSNGKLFVVDQGANRIRQIVIAGGTVTTIAGGSAAITPPAPNTTPILYQDGDGLTAALFNTPAAITVDSNGVLYVADNKNNNIRRLTQTGGAWNVDTFCGPITVGDTTKYSTPAPGNTDGAGSGASFRAPQGIVFANDNLYVADTSNSIIRKIALSNRVSSTITGSVRMTGFSDGTPVATRFKAPVGIAVDAQGNIFTADEGQGSPYRTLRQTVPSGDTLTILSGSAFQSNADVYTVAVAPNGDLYILDKGSTTTGATAKPLVYKYSAGVLTTFFDGSKSTPVLSNPRGIAVNKTGTSIFVGDATNILQISTADASVQGSITGLGSPQGLSVDASGAIFWCDFSNNNVKMATSIAGTPVVIAGGASSGFKDGALGTGLLNKPQGTALVTDASGIATAVFVIDASNHAIRKIDLATKIMTTVVGASSTAGTVATGVPTIYGGHPGIGPNLGIYNPLGIAAGPDGTLYVTTNDGIMAIMPY